MNNLTKIASLASLALVTLPSLLYVAGVLSLDAVKLTALIGTIAWFIATPLWMDRKSKISGEATAN